jgi:hypothetical protein
MYQCPCDACNAINIDLTSMANSLATMRTYFKNMKKDYPDLDYSSVLPLLSGAVTAVDQLHTQFREHTDGIESEQEAAKQAVEQILSRLTDQVLEEHGLSPKSVEISVSL